MRGWARNSDNSPVMWCGYIIRVYIIIPLLHPHITKTHQWILIKTQTIWLLIIEFHIGLMECNQRFTELILSQLKRENRAHHFIGKFHCEGECLHLRTCCRAASESRENKWMRSEMYGEDVGWKQRSCVTEDVGSESWGGGGRDRKGLYLQNQWNQSWRPTWRHVVQCIHSNGKKHTQTQTQQTHTSFNLRWHNYDGQHVYQVSIGGRDNVGRNIHGTHLHS